MQDVQYELQIKASFFENDMTDIYIFKLFPANI